jgi:hypothetical protein
MPNEVEVTSSNPPSPFLCGHVKKKKKKKIAKEKEKRERERIIYLEATFLGSYNHIAICYSWF